MVPSAGFLVSADVLCRNAARSTAVGSRVSEIVDYCMHMCMCMHM